MKTTLKQEPLNIIVAGVGGQGNVLASQVIAVAAAQAGYRVAVGETFGVSQRGGSVMSHVRISLRQPSGPLIPQGRAHIIAGFEPLETLRVALDFAHRQTMVIMNNRPNYPLGCLLGEDQYPQLADIQKAMAQLADQLHILPATEMAKQIGNPMAANMVMTGALVGSNMLPLGPKHFTDTIKSLFQGNILELNLKAFDLGKKHMLQHTPPPKKQ